MNNKKWQLTLIAMLVTLGMVVTACAPAPATTSGDEAAVATMDEDSERVIRVGFRSNWAQGFNIFPYPTYKAQGDIEPYFYM
ncbi:MAG: hypothetical protein OXF76_03395, partial [Caldilineaceae bacterium]|nr:hypothetical protein [Caldilineaceae bacterium]